MKKAKKTMLAFLEAWKKHDYETMYKHTQLTWRAMHPLSELVTLFEAKQLLSYRICKTMEGNPEICAIDFKIYCRLRHVASNKAIAVTYEKVRTVPELDAYRNHASGFYGVNPISLLGNRPPLLNEQ